MVRARRKATSVFGIVLLASALAAPSASADQAVPPPPGASVTLVGDTSHYDCEGTSLAASEPLTGFTVTHAKFHVSAGGDSPGQDRKSCRLAVQVHAPEGYTFAIERGEHRVVADLTRGASGLVAIGDCFQGPSCSAPSRYAINGPFSGVWTHKDEVPPDQLVFMRCDEPRAVLFYTELRVTQGSSASLTNRIAWDTPETHSSYGLSWKTCP